MDWDAIERHGREDARKARADADDYVPIWPTDQDLGQARTGRYLRTAERKSMAGNIYSVHVLEDRDGEEYAIFASTRAVEAAVQRTPLKPGHAVYLEYHGDREYTGKDGERRFAKDLSCSVVDVGAMTPAPPPANPQDPDDELPF